LKNFDNIVSYNSLHELPKTGVFG